LTYLYFSYINIVAQYMLKSDISQMIRFALYTYIFSYLHSFCTLIPFFLFIFLWFLQIFLFTNYKLCPFSYPWVAQCWFNLEWSHFIRLTTHCVFEVSQLESLEVDFSSELPIVRDEFNHERCWLCYEKRMQREI